MVWLYLLISIATLARSLILSPSPFNYAKSVVCVCARSCFDTNFQSKPENLKWCFLFCQKWDCCHTFFSAHFYQNDIIYLMFACSACYFVLFLKTFLNNIANQPFSLTISHTHTYTETLATNKWTNERNGQTNRERERKKFRHLNVCCVCIKVYFWSFVDGLVFLLNLKWTMDIIYKSFHFGCKHHLK